MGNPTVASCLLVLALLNGGYYCSPNNATTDSSRDLLASGNNWRPPDDDDDFVNIKKPQQQQILLLEKEDNKRFMSKRYLQSSDINILKATVCAPIKEPICQTSLYNLTLVPNEWGQATQADAAAQIKRFNWILRSKCSPLLAIFLCIFFLPVCSEKAVVFPYTEMLVISRPPCAEMCEAIRDECHGWLHRNGLDWPKAFSCDKLPPKEGEQECFYPVSNVLTLQGSKQALKNMIALGVVPMHTGERMEEEDENMFIGGTGLNMGGNSHEIGLEEPSSHFVLLVSISVFISLLVLLSVSIAVVRCYFQVCSGSACTSELNKRAKFADRSCCERFFATISCTRLPKMSPIEETATLQDINKAGSEQNLRKKRAYPEFEEQSKTMSIYDVEEQFLPHTTTAYKLPFEQPYQHTQAMGGRMRLSSSNHWNFPCEDIPPPQSFTITGGSLAHRRPSVSWKRSSEVLNVDNESPTRLARNNIVSSVSMTFEKSNDDLETCKLAKQSKGSLKHQASQQQIISRSQPELDSGEPPVWLHRNEIDQLVFERPNTLRRSRTTTATIGVGTSPSLATRRPVVPSSIERKSNGIISPNVKISLPTTNAPPSNNAPVAKHAHMLKIATRSGSGPSSKPQATTPTKYSITLFVDEASRVKGSVKAYEERGTEQAAAPPPVTTPTTAPPAPAPYRAYNSKTLPQKIRSSDQRPASSDVEQQKHQAIRELFYV